MQAWWINKAYYEYQWKKYKFSDYLTFSFWKTDLKIYEKFIERIKRYNFKVVHFTESTDSDYDNMIDGNPPCRECYCVVIGIKPTKNFLKLLSENQIIWNLQT